MKHISVSMAFNKVHILKVSLLLTSQYIIFIYDIYYGESLYVAIFE